jgi:predicted lipase
MPSPPFSLADALQLGQFVQAAYELFATGDPPDFAPPAGYSLVSKVYADDITDKVPDLKVFGFIARSDTDVVVAIRGTQGFFEWLKDVFFVLVPFPFLDAGRTEQGFTDFYSSFHTGPDNLQPRVVDALRELLADGSIQSLRITGHSLGAALATLLAIDVAGNKVISPRVYTFASPRVGDKVFAGTYDGFVPDSWRIANLHDIVPHLPPSLAGYAHVDAELPLNSDDKARHNIQCWHTLATYLNTLDASVPLDPSCQP